MQERIPSILTHNRYAGALWVEMAGRALQERLWARRPERRKGGHVPEAAGRLVWLHIEGRVRFLMKLEK